VRNSEYQELNESNYKLNEYVETNVSWILRTVSYSLKILTTPKYLAIDDNSLFYTRTSNSSFSFDKIDSYMEEICGSNITPQSSIHIDSSCEHVIVSDE